MSETPDLPDAVAPSPHHLPDIVYVVDVEEQRNVFVNESVETVLLYSREDIAEMGANLFPSIIHPDDLPSVGEHYARLPQLSDAQSAIIEYRVRRKDGVYLWYRSTDTIYQRNADGSPKLLLGSAYDITPVKEREETISLLNRELAHRVQNLFSVNLSMVRMARRKAGDLDTVLDDLEMRIAAMGAVQGKLRGLARNGNRDLRDIIEDTFAVLAPGRYLKADIGDISISEAQLNSVGIVLYEMFVASTMRGADAEHASAVSITATQENGFVTIIWRDRLESEPFQSDEEKDTVHLMKLAVSVIQGKLDLSFDKGDFVATLRFHSVQSIAPAFGD